MNLKFSKKIKLLHHETIQKIAAHFMYSARVF